jgi:murein DD-endopeptidase MepM/ murein hydrolase activator NlpD
MISNPIKGFKNKKYPKGQVSQWFGENGALYLSVKDSNGVSILTKGHNGIDIISPWGTPLYAVESGTVCEVKTDPSGYGMHIRFLTETGNEWTYGHLSDIFVKIGDKITVGQKIANMGNTGFVVSDMNAGGYWVLVSNKYAGTHLHLGCRKYKLDKKGWRYNSFSPKMTILNSDNGSQGSIDFSDQFNPDSMMGDIEILRRELEKTPEDEWWMKFIRALKFFN